MTEIRSLLLTDVVDSTQLSGTLGDAAMAALWASHDRVARDLLPPHGGREIDKTDGMLLLFERPDQALRYAAGYHAALATLNPPLRARAGLHVGPVILRENSADDVARGAKPLEVDGMAKPTAARVMALARGGQTLLSADAVKALGDAAAAFGSTQSHGHWRMKGVAEPMELFELGEGPFQPPPDGEKTYRVAQTGGRWLPVRQLPNNLPQQTTSFHGREKELDDLATALRSARLVTLLGMGGLGKTRLSLQVAAEAMAEFPDGVWFLDLSALRDPAHVVQEAAQLLQVQEEPPRPLLQSLTAHLRDKRLLLVIDNCEHLVQAAAQLAHAVLKAAPEVRLMASSREALRVPGEVIYPVLPLPLPEAHADPAVLMRSPAVQLFIDRAQAQRPGFSVEADQAAPLAELVTRLEGIPLALELAAARVRSMSVADINARLKDRYKLLSAGSRVLQLRQMTLRALVDWSYDLLQPTEQQLLQRLGVFVGGFDLATVEAVCGADPIDPLDIVDLLDSLVDKSLITLDTTSADTRYRMLETLREYAHEKLVASGDEAEFAQRQCDHFWAFTRQVRDGLRGADQAGWVRRAEADLDNLRAAMAWARGDHCSDPLLAAKIPVALQGFFAMRGRLHEGREHLRLAAELPAVQQTDVARAHTLYAGAALAHVQGYPVEAQQMLRECLALRRKLQDDEGTAGTLSTLAMTLLSTGESADAQVAAEEARELFERIGNRLGLAIVQMQLGHVFVYLGRWDAARRSTQQALALAREIKHLETEGECEWLLGEIAQSDGDSSAAHAHLQRALQRSADAGDRNGEARAKGSLGRLVLEQGELDAARSALGSALRAYVAFEMRSEMIDGLEDHADLAEAMDQVELAVRLRAAAAVARQEIGFVPSPDRQLRADGRLSDLRARLDDAVFEAAVKAGLGWPLKQALDAALALAQVADAAEKAAALAAA